MSIDEGRKAPQPRAGSLPLTEGVSVRRVYDEPRDDDGVRVLVDRIWPRGLRKSEAQLDEWCKDVAPSTTLRMWYGHDPAKFEEFRRRYRAELTEPGPARALHHLRQVADAARLTLLTATMMPNISQAAVLADLLCRLPVLPLTNGAGSGALPTTGQEAAGLASSDVRSTRQPSARREAGVTGEIVVGVDGSPAARAALEWAVQEARLRRCSVRAVMAWHEPPAYGDAWLAPFEGFDPVAECEQVLGEVVSAVRRQEANTAAPDGNTLVAITSEAVRGHPGHALLSASADADLLVVGCRGRAGLVGALLGSVSRHVSAHSRCPVVVIPDPERQHPAPR